MTTLIIGIGSLGLSIGISAPLRLAALQAAHPVRLLRPTLVDHVVGKAEGSAPPGRRNHDGRQRVPSAVLL